MSKEKISAKQEQILNYIKENILSKGYPPTVRDICSAVGLSSTSSVHAHLNTLEEKGYIRRDPTKPRAIEILDDDGFNLARR
ncbi:MAG: MarR family transcriptional regulator, partial [Eubacterium sp.]|nr:MarR family transcriptional regulator [Eubacterium sp.]